MEVIKAKSSIHFGNLFSGNEALTEDTNKFINDNIDVLSQDTDPVVHQAVGTYIRNIFNHVFDLFPLEELFPK